MASPKKKLKDQLLKTKRLRQIDNAAVVRIMAEIRQLLEANNEKQAYPVLNMYCNWSLHTALSASSFALQILAALSKTVTGYVVPGSASAQTSRHEVMALFQRVEDAFAVPHLRREVDDLSRRYGLPGFLTAIDHNWRVFGSLLISELSEKPLEFPVVAAGEERTRIQKKARKTYDGLLEDAGGNENLIIRATWFSEGVDPWDENPEGSGEPSFSWNLKNFREVTFVGKINGIVRLPDADTYLIERI